MLNHLGERIKDKISTSEKGITVTVIDPDGNTIALNKIYNKTGPIA